MNKLKKTGKQINRKEQHAPTLVLSHVDAFMVANTRQRRVVYTDDDVAKRDGAEATKPREHGNAAIEAPASDFNRALDDSAFRAARHRNE